MHFQSIHVGFAQVIWFPKNPGSTRERFLVQETKTTNFSWGVSKYLHVLREF